MRPTKREHEVDAGRALEIERLKRELQESRARERTARDESRELRRRLDWLQETSRTFATPMRGGAERHRARRRIAAQYAVGRVLADASSVEGAAEEILRVLVRDLGWSFGLYWSLEGGGLRCRALWPEAGEEGQSLEEACRDLVFRRGEGLPGRAWATGEPVCVEDLSAREGARRRGMAREAGLKSALAFPARDGGRTSGVFELFGREAGAPDEEMMRVAAVIGNQLGHFAERRRAEEALKEREASYRTLTTNIPGAVFRAAVVDGQPSMRFVSDRIRELTGYPAADFVADRRRNYGDVVHPEDRPNNDREVWRSFEAREPYSIEYRILHSDGGVRWMDERGSGVYDEDGALRSVDGVIFDVTQRKHTEEALRESEERFRLMADTVPDMIWLTDAEGRVEFLNRRWYEYAGTTPQRTTAAELAAESVHPDDAPGLMRAFGEAMEKGTGFEVEQRNRSASGEYRWFLNRAMPHRDPRTGEIVRWFGAGTDIHDRKRAEEALRESEERYRSLFDTMAEGFTMVEVIRDESGRPTDVLHLELNPAFELQFGIPRDRLLGRRMTEGFPPGDPERMVPFFARMADAGEPTTFEQYVEMLDRQFEVSAYPRGADRIGLFYRDITERKRREANAAFLAEIGDDLSRLSTRDEIMRTVGAKVGAFLGISNCLFAEIDEARDVAAIEHAWNVADGMPDVRGVHRLSEFVTDEFRRAARDGEIIVIDDTDADPRTDAARYAAFGIGAFVTVPFRRDGGWRYLFTANAAAARAWRGDEVELIQELTNRVFPRLERARAEETLRESEERFRAFVTASSDTVYRMSPDWSEMRSLVGKGFVATTEDPSSAWLERYVPEEDRPRVRGAIEEAVRTKGALELEHRVFRLDGTVGWAISRAVPLLDGRGEISEWFGTASDVTVRREAEEALRESEERYRSLFVSMDEGYAVVEVTKDENGAWDDFLFIEVNPAFEKQTGMVEPVGRTASEILGTPNPAWARVYGRVAASGEPVRFEEEEPVVGRVFDLYAFRLGGAGSRRVAVLFTDITERKRTEEALRESEERLQKAVSIETVGVLFFSLDGRMTEANEAFARMSGYDREELLGSLHWEALTAPEFRTITERAAGELAARGETAPYEKEFVRKDGSRWWGLCAPRRLSGSGPGTECVEFILDITESKRAEEALRESEERFRAVANLVPDLLWSNDPSGRTDWYNRRWTEYTGQSLEEAAGRGWLDAIHPDDRDGSLRTFQGSLDGGEPLRQEYRIRAADGSYRWFLVRAELVREAGGRITRWFGAATDVHEQRKAIEALRENQEWLHIAQRAARSGTWEWDLRTGEIRWSDEHRELFGFDADGPMTRERWWAAVHPEDLPRIEEAGRRCAEENEEWPEIDYRIFRDGGVRWISARGRTERDAQGRAIRIMGTSVDATERKVAEEERDRLLARKWVADAEVAERERISRELHDRVAHSMGVAHQSLELYEVLRGKDDGRAVEKLKLAREMTKASLESTRNLSAELRQLDAEEGLEAELAHLLDVSVPPPVESSLRVEGDEAGVPGHVRGQLFLILREAIRNAVSHSGCRSIAVGLEVEPGRVVGRVEDDGTGFDATDGRAGVGLRSMRERVALLDGSLNLDCRPGEGTLIEVTVPLGGER